MNFRKYSLALAESFDAWRIIPRSILVAYSALVLNLYLWFKSIPTFVQERCDAGILKLLLDAKYTIEQANEMACSVVDVVGGPTAAQSAFVTTVIGLSTGIFGLYTATGRKWDSGLPADLALVPKSAPKAPKSDIPTPPEPKAPPISDDEEEPLDTGPKPP